MVPNTNARIEIRKALVSLPFYLGLLPVAYLFISLIFVTHFREETMDVCVYLAKLGLVAWVVVAVHVEFVPSARLRAR